MGGLLTPGDLARLFAVAVGTAVLLVLVVWGICRWIEKRTPAVWRLATAAILVGFPNVYFMCLIVELFRHSSGAGQTGWPIVMLGSGFLYWALIVKNFWNGLKVWFLQLPVFVLIALGLLPVLKSIGLAP
jgi:hypothetical protein